MKPKKLQGQVAIITGGSRGLGAAAAYRLAAAGAVVVITARSEDQVEAVATQIRAEGGRAIGVPADVSDLEQIEEVIEATLDQFGRVDILINNAAIVWPIDEIAETDAEEWAYNIHVNLVGPLYMARNVLPLMLEQKSGRILNISSGAAVSPISGLSAYCAAKAGLDMWTNVLAKEIAGTNITANCLYPGMVDTDMQTDIRSVDTSESELDFSFWHKQHENQRLLTPQTVAQLIYWIVGPWGRKRSGEIFNASDPRWLRLVADDLGVTLAQQDAVDYKTP